jgi:RNA polymerase sigma-70 factor (ECF subfamily)
MALGVADTDLITRARAGDEVAFSQLVDPYRRELQVHCYRILGSVQDAEDQVQETLLAAWQGLAGFAGRASIRTWLYRIATNRCLNALRSTRRRPPLTVPPATAERPEPNRAAPVIWLEPCPDVLLDGLADSTPGPEARYEAKEAISLAFVTALQLLPPRQRAALVLCDVAGFPAKDVSRMLQSSPDSVASALRRARATLQSHRSAPQQPPPEPNSPVEQGIVARFTSAYEAGDVAALISLCTDDVVLTTPLAAGEYQGRDMAASLLAVAVFRPGSTFRLITTRANGQPAFGVYVRDLHATIAHANGLLYSR